MNIFVRHFYVSTYKSNERIGPHNFDVISVLVGNLLGDAHIEFRKPSSRVSLHVGSPNRSYIQWLHEFYSSRGYCSTNPLVYQPQIGKNSKVYYSTKINTFSFQSFNWLYELFMREINGKKVKRVPNNIGDYLTAQALAVWFMDDATRSNSGVLFCTDAFVLEDVQLLQEVLRKKFHLHTTTHYGPTNTEKKPTYRIYIKKSSIPLFRSLIEKYVHASMIYKLPNINNS
uniref:Putative site-specific DNA endonuclease n=1 Tax=Nephroselmis olivacea TaxID=31312 RepID=Q9TC98_NEPOL|nr:putative site-specific DNA endonuclease [Nephroselmis olivacea]AAF03199.1 putative site-specific DNA endonuclease [Nephroselmis olivacea]